MSRILSVRRVGLAVALGGATVLLSHRSATSAPVASPGRFHLELVRAEPAPNATVTASPKQLKLWFSESIELAGTRVQLENARNEAVKLGKLSVDTAALAPAVIVVPQPLPAGKYTVTWHASDDGHPSTGKYSFLVK
jgi:methionine-rich copper-binding protein CopC